MADESISDNNIAALRTDFRKNPNRHQLPPKQLGAASALFFRDTARQAVALLMRREQVKRPRKGYFAFWLLNAKLWRSSLGTYQAHSTHRPAPKLKSVGVQPFGFGKGWSPSQGRNSASRSQKFAHIKRRKSVIPNTERTKPQIKKPHAEKKSRPS